MSIAALFDRRRMLLGLAAASSAAATATVAASPKLSENPELIRLAQELPAVEAHYRAAQAHQAATEAKWMPLWPIAPDDITEPGSRDFYNLPFEKGFKGGATRRPGEANPRNVTSAFTFRYEANRARRVLKSKKLAAGPVDGRTRAEWEAELVKADRCHALASKYEAETKRISEVSNYEGSWKAHAAAAAALEAHVTLIMDQPDCTMEGLVIKAQALEVWGRVDELYRLTRRGADWHGQIAASILRHAGAAA
ncbi:hypothetical protein [Bosea sp. (in: a-proteobacteria)]|uniref:hypothetical protein n=1 Tax=Bosea sp. (in: a-proteobacteria) TaxID=1871050 RepID=UPI002B45E983|nr:hypothetical protein [Bosea sp. (in: a-proteobacteria)]WRH56671.1 MAG: hypothetical protein RSE11_16715 [Bosea sp. (in: a-proteobacteria)]